MNALWPLEEATVRQVQEALSSRRPRAYTTIMTILDRMAQKGVVTRRKVGRTYVYRANLSLSDAKQKAIEDAYQKVRASAETVAKAGGRALGELIYANVDSFEQPGTRVYGEQSESNALAFKVRASPTESFTPQTTAVTAHVNAIFGLR